MQKDQPSITLALKTIKEKKQAIIFTNTKNSAEKTAEDLSKKIKKGSTELLNLSEQVLRSLSSPTKQCKRLSDCIKKGIAFHHAGLNYKQKELIEESFKKKIIKVICATPTLAAGCDLPAYRVILKDLRRYTHRGLDWIPTLEYLQMSGRAGRPKYDNKGQAIAIAKTPAAKQEIIERYIKGDPEDIYSKLAVEPVLRTYLLSLINSGFIIDDKSIISFFNKTFWAYQFKDLDKLSYTIQKMLDLLISCKFLESSKDIKDFSSALDMTKTSYKATLIGKRTAELYIDPLTAHHLIKGLKRSSSKQQEITAFSLLQLVSHTLEMRPLLKVKMKEYEMIESKLIEYSSSLLDLEPTMYDPDYDEFLASIKTAVFLNEWIEEKDEEYILNTYNVRPGEIRVKIDRADWLLYSSQELARILKNKEILAEIIKLRLRIKHGAKEELLPLLKLKNIGRRRARKLYTSRIKDISDIKKASFQTLVQILGEKISLDIKEQVGQKIKEVPKGKRIGQTSLNKFR